ncbi:hypothetical protein DD238_004825 [Peronospora effusa]|uniref:Uncharacterized protein n=1 Tax=Peronospora effusa TaxID=542832 RepID=A0A3M6VJA8_9STRA|nr:hypothetical protein DD238_004825 [Peronospora effusa]
MKTKSTMSKTCKKAVHPMPSTLSSNTDPENNTVGNTARGAATGAAAGMGLWGLATPIVNLVGFGAGGIASGSTAASMMSAAAVANGGGVASGSVVAIMQSIGAIGLAAPLGLGLVAGGAIIGGTALFVKAKLSMANRANLNNAACGADDENEDKGLWVLAEISLDSGKTSVRTFNDEYKARNAFLNSSAMSRALFDPEQKIALELGWNESMTETVGM